jgi:hypothetical protein
LYFIEILIIVFLIKNFKEYFYQMEHGVFILNGIVFYICVSAIALTNATFVRLSWFPYFFVIIGLSYIYHFINDSENKKFFKTMVFLYFGLLFIRLVIIIDGGDWIPYDVFFSGTPREGQFYMMEYR